MIKRFALTMSIVYVVISGALSVWVTTELTFVGFDMKEQESIYLDNIGKYNDLESEYFAILFDDLEERALVHGLVVTQKTRYISTETVLGLAEAP